MVKSADPQNGRIAVVMPQGVLFHGGKEGDIRKQIIKADMIEAVITLVGGLFYGAGVSACILILNNNKPAVHKGKVLLIDASKIYTALRAQNIMTDDEVEEVFDLYNKYTDIVEKSKVATIEEIAAKDYTLAVNSYIEKEEQETIDPAVVKAQYYEAVENVKNAEAHLRELLVKELYN